MTPIVIPSYEPDERLLQLLETLKAGSQGPVVIVDDGSGAAYKDIFERASAYVDVLGGAVLTHEVNRGKGRALKTAFAFILKKYPDAIGCVTADSDGQHTAKCIEKVSKTLEEHPDSLVLGVRRFDGEDVPWRSRMGNGITERVFAYVAGVHVTDTQTGLRAFGREAMEQFVDVSGDRYEYEINMLLQAAQTGRNICEVWIDPVRRWKVLAGGSTGGWRKRRVNPRRADTCWSARPISFLSSWSPSSISPQ